MAKYVHRTPVRDAIGKEYTAAMGRYVAKLAVLGYQALQYAYNEGHAEGDKPKKKDENGKVIADGKWRHRSRNLHDSFASAVYVKGVLQEDTIRFVGPELSDDYFGREEARRYFREPEVDVSGDVCLLCIAAVYYAQLLEEGRHRGGYKIKVISGASDYINAHIWELEDEVFGIKNIRAVTGTYD